MKTNAPYGMELVDDCSKCTLRKEGFFCRLGNDSLEAFERVKFTSSYPAGAVLFVEGQVPRGVYMLCTGRVKLTMASPEGKTIIVRIAEPGELLGLHSAISGELTNSRPKPCNPARWISSAGTIFQDCCMNTMM